MDADRNCNCIREQICPLQARMQQQQQQQRHVDTTRIEDTTMTGSTTIDNLTHPCRAGGRQARPALHEHHVALRSRANRCATGFFLPTFHLDLSNISVRWDTSGNGTKSSSRSFSLGAWAMYKSSAPTCARSIVGRQKKKGCSVVSVAEVELRALAAGGWFVPHGGDKKNAMCAYTTSKLLMPVRYSMSCYRSLQ